MGVFKRNLSEWSTSSRAGSRFVGSLGFGGFSFWYFSSVTWVPWPFKSLLFIHGIHGIAAGLGQVCHARDETDLIGKYPEESWNDRRLVVENHENYSAVQELFSFVI